MRIYLNCADVMAITGCSKSKAYIVIKEVNNYAIQIKKTSFPRGKCNKYLFADVYGIPVKSIDELLRG